MISDIKPPLSAQHPPIYRSSDTTFPSKRNRMLHTKLHRDSAINRTQENVVSKIHIQVKCCVTKALPLLAVDSVAAWWPAHGLEAPPAA